jgi:tetratricopeptide (TPR) repeat protein
MLADAYFSASLAGADMRKAADALESTRGWLVESADPFRAWAAMDFQIGRADLASLVPCLVELRLRFRKAFAQDELSNFRRSFERDGAAGWTELVDRLGRALLFWREDLCSELLDAGFPCPPGESETLQMLRKGFRGVRLNRWADTREMFLFLGRNARFPMSGRARYLARAALVELYYFGGAEPALKLLEEAQQALGPEAKECEVACALGRLYRHGQKLDLAKKTLEESITLDPLCDEPYCYRGECAEAEGDPAGAEEWYRRSIANASGGVTGYTFLALLLGRGAPKVDRGEIRSLLERALLVDPRVRFQTLLDAARVFLGMRDHDGALGWIDRGLAMDASWADGYAMRADVLADRKAFPEAMAACERALQADPEWYSRSTWATLAIPEAEEFLLAALRQDPSHPVAGTAAETLLDIYIRGGNERTVPFLETLRSILGEKFEPRYHNYLGNLSFDKKEYSEAAAAYRRAAECAPSTALYQSNLAEALAALSQWQPAIDALARMFQLDRDEKKYRARLGTVYNSWGNSRYQEPDYEGAAALYRQALEMRPDDAAIHSNLALALTEIREPGKASSSIDQAVAALDTALGLSPEREDFRRRRDLLVERREMIARFGEPALGCVPFTEPLRLELSDDLIDRVVEPGTSDLTKSTLALIGSIRSWIWEEYGVTLPGMTLSRTSVSASGWYRFSVYECPIASGSVSPDQRMFSGGAEALRQLGIEAKPAADPLTGAETHWVERRDWERIAGAGYKLWDVIAYPVYEFAGLLRPRLAAFLGVEETAVQLEQRKVECRPAILNTPERLSAFTKVLRGLVAESVAIVELEEIAGKFIELAAQGVNCTGIVEELRRLPKVRPSLPGNDPRHSYITLSPELETLLAKCIWDEDREPILAIDPQVCMEMLNQVRSAVSSTSESHFVLVVDTGRIRPFLRKLVELEFPRLYVLARLELLDSSAARVVGNVAWTAAEVSSDNVAQRQSP